MQGFREIKSTSFMPDSIPTITKITTNNNKTKQAGKKKSVAFG